MRECATLLEVQGEGQSETSLESAGNNIFRSSQELEMTGSRIDSPQPVSTMQDSSWARAPSAYTCIKAYRMQTTKRMGHATKRICSLMGRSTTGSVTDPPLIVAAFVGCERIQIFPYSLYLYLVRWYISTERGEVTEPKFADGVSVCVRERDRQRQTER